MFVCGGYFFIVAKSYHALITCCSYMNYQLFQLAPPNALILKQSDSVRKA